MDIILIIFLLSISSLFISSQQDPGPGTIHPLGKKITDVASIKQEPFYFYFFLAKKCEQNGEVEEGLRNIGKANDSMPEFGSGKKGLRQDEMIDFTWLWARLLNKKYLKSKQLNWLDSSYKKYIDVSNRINALRQSYDMDHARIILAGNASRINKEGLKCSLLLFKITMKNEYKEQAYLFSEQSKCGALFAARLEAQARIFANVPQNILNRDKELKDSLSWLYHDITKSPKEICGEGEKRIKNIEETIVRLENARKNLIDFLDRTYHDYFSYKYNTEIPGIETIQYWLKNDQTIIEYTFLKDTLICFVINKKKYELVEIPFDSSLFKNITCLQKFLFDNKSSHSGHKEFKSFVDTSRVLYKILMEPLMKNVHNRRLIIIPDSILSTFPFEVLLTENPKTDAFDYTTLPYLLEKYAVSYHYMASLLPEKILINPHNNKTLLAFAPEYKKVSPRLDTFLADRGYRDVLADIPNNKVELKKISENINCEDYINKEATKKRFIQVSGDYSFIHLSMHALVDDAKPWKSVLVFTNDSSAEDDGLLLSDEISNLGLNARMVVLSACNTGSGKVLQGESVMSLARSFLYNGVNSLVMTLWPLKDITAVDIMSMFYFYISREYTLDIAMQKAKLEYLKNADKPNTPPHYWSACIVLGNVNPVEIEKNHGFFTSILIISAALLLCLLLVSLIFCRRRIASFFASFLK